MAKSEKGTLFVVATPIGNLGDLTKRAERVLSEVDLVAAEDTRRTRQLLSSLNIKKPMESYYEPKEEPAAAKIIGLLLDGKDVALVTDGGTPAVSDPGYRLVRAAHQNDITVIPVPGASALAAALSASGMPTDLVTFAGFLPHKRSARVKALSDLAGRPDTIVVFESPKRLMALLEDAIEVLGDREVVVMREITKVYEERIGGKISGVIDELKDREIKGEIVVLFGGAESFGRPVTDDELRGMVEEALRSGKSVKDAAAEVAGLAGAPRKKVYSLALELKRESEEPG